jgi:uncharacterized protein YecE (DUF72 family)
METWARRLAEMWPAAADVFVYFNNDAHGCALRDAIVLARISERLGMHPTRVPPLSEVTVSRT